MKEFGSTSLKFSADPFVEFPIKKGMRVNLYGFIYKVIAVKPDKSLKLKFLSYDASLAPKAPKINKEKGQ